MSYIENFRGLQAAEEETITTINSAGFSVSSSNADVKWISGDGSTSGDSISGGTTYTYPNTTISPYIYTSPAVTSVGTGVTITASPFNVTSPDKKYVVFILPQLGVVPNKVYVSGRLVTVGILGTDVQAAFAGDKLVFAPGELDIIRYNERLTVALDYGDWLYHYNIELDTLGQIDFEEDSNVAPVKLLSKVAQR